MSVLIIEDNRDLVQVLAEVLNENGFSVESAHTGEEGLEKALQHFEQPKKVKKDGTNNTRSKRQTKADK